MRFRELALAVVAFICLSGELRSQDMPVPPSVQAVLFKKILSFDKGLSAKGSVEVVVVGGGEEVTSALKSAGLNATVGSAPGGDVVYVGPGAAIPKGATAKAGILSISGVPSFAEKGMVSIALDVEGGKPKIVVNMAQLKAEGHELSADLLKMARIIQ